MEWALSFILLEYASNETLLSTWSSCSVQHNGADELICTVLVTLETAVSPQNIL